MPHQIGRFEVVSRLGAGGMAEVFLARQVGPGGFVKHVAIKRLQSHMADRHDVVQMFLDEARLVARFNHPNLVQLYELGRDGTDYYIAQEFIHGVSLKRIVALTHGADQPLDRVYAARLVARAAQALHYAHTYVTAEGKSLNLIHRDISPDNIMLSFDGVVKVLDFGIAKAADNLHETTSNSIKGKVAYLAPERLDMTSVIDHRSDVFALGVVLYFLCVGSTPVAGRNDFERLLFMKEQRIPDPRSADATVPDALALVVLRATERDVQRRYPSARAMAEDLERFIASQHPLEDHELATFARELVPPEERKLATATSPDLQWRPTVPIEDESFVEIFADTMAEQDVPQAAAADMRDLLRDLIPADDEEDPLLLPGGGVRPTRPLDASDEDMVVSADAAVPPTGTQEREGGADVSVKSSSSRGALWRVGLFAVALAGIAAAWQFGPQLLPRELVPHDATEPEVASDGPLPTAATPSPIEAPDETVRAPEEVDAASELSPKQGKKIPARGRVTVRSSPPATVFIDGKRIGRAPITDHMLGVGTHRLKLEERSLGLRHVETFRVEAGREAVLARKFAPAKVRVLAIPFGEVFVNGAKKGLTPLDAPLVLYPGTHTVRVHCSRTDKSKTEKVTVRGGESLTLKYDLR